MRSAEGVGQLETCRNDRANPLTLARNKSGNLGKQGGKNIRTTLSEQDQFAIDGLGFPPDYLDFERAISRSPADLGGFADSIGLLGKLRIALQWRSTLRLTRRHGGRGIAIIHDGPCLLRGRGWQR